MNILPECKSVQDVQRAVSEGLAEADCTIPLPGGYAIQCFTPLVELYAVTLVSKYVYTTDDQFVAGSLDFCLKYLVEQGVLEDDGITTALLLRVMENSARNGVAWLELQPSHTGHYIVRESGKYLLRARGTSSGPGKTVASGQSIIQMLREAIRLGVLK